jgi:putative addiction module component (TIGR02574 family)
MAAPTTTPSMADVLELAKKLPRDQQWELIEELEATLPPPPPDGMTAAEFRAELDRRWEEYLANPSIARPVEEVLEEIRRKYREHG